MLRPVVTSVFVLCLAALAFTAAVKPAPSAQQCTQDVADRRECGFFGINEQTCQSRGCCWLVSMEPNAPWCYHPKGAVEPVVPSTQQPVAPVTQKPSSCTCEDDEIYKGSCYVIRSEFRNFENSEKGCQEIGGHLVAIEDKDEMDHVKTILKKWPRNTLVWIGLHDAAVEGTWKWVGSNAEATYTNWRRGEPNDDWGKEDCAATYANDSPTWLGLWNDIPCSEHGIPYLCEVPLTVEVPTAKPVDCDAADLYQGNCYKIIKPSSMQDFDDCENDCQALGGHLVSILDSKEMDHVSEVLRKWPTETLVWIGANDKKKEGTFRWVGSSKELTYTNWRRGEPNDDWGKEDCATAYSMASRTWLGLWNDVPCGDSGIPYMCKIPVSGSAKPQPPQTPCESDEMYQGRCYKIYPTLQNFVDSESSCVAEGGHLVSITDADEMDHVKSVLAKWPKETLVWIGLNDKRGEDNFSWIGSTGSVTYTNWRRGEPNDDWGKEDCVAAYSMADRSWLGLWNDIPCSEHGIPYMCEI